MYPIIEFIYVFKKLKKILNGSDLCLTTIVFRSLNKFSKIKELFVFHRHPSPPLKVLYLGNCESTNVGTKNHKRMAHWNFKILKWGCQGHATGIRKA